MTYPNPGDPQYPQQNQPPYAQGPHGQPPNVGPYPPPYQYPAPSSTNGLAIASLVLGILWIYWLGSVLALIFGYIARNQIKQRREGGDGLAIAGIVLGWIGMATLVLIIIILVAAANHSHSGGPPAILPT